MPAIKYKLFSAQTGDGKAPCAFFASPKGCRNGDSCKFSHEQLMPNQSSLVQASGMRLSIAENGSMVSSESDDERKTMEAEEDSPFHPPGTAKTALDNDGTNKKKKARRGKKENSDPFANPHKKAKTEENAPVISTSIQLTSNKKNVAESQPRNDNPHLSTPKSKAVVTAAVAADFKSLNLPIAPFVGLSRSTELIGVNNAKKKKLSTSAPASSSGQITETLKQSTTKMSLANAPSVVLDTKLKELPLPESNQAAATWLEMVKTTRAHPRFNQLYDFDKWQAKDDEIGSGGRSTWILAKPYGAWSSSLPQVVSIDCEMCETQDPVTGKCDPRALCRISVVDATTDQVLLDSLVKPQWPVRDHRAWINGITAEHLENVQFTLRHAQAFLLTLCSDQTVVLGHSAHNDLAALRWEHYCVVDSAFLFRAEDSPTATVSLKDLAQNILGSTMPDVHDSVNDSRTALQCLKHYLKNNGKVEPIKRSNPSGKSSNHNLLFIHRIPAKGCDKSHLSKMFLVHSDIQPTVVQDIEFAGGVGKTHVVFKTKRHADLAFEMLDGKAEPDASGKQQKKVFLKDGSYIRVRKMFTDKDTKGEGPKKQSQA